MRINRLVIFNIFLLFIILISEISSETKDITKNDGVSWMKVSDSYKIGYVSGFMSALYVAEQEFGFYSELFEEELKKEFNDSWNKINFYNMTIGQISDGVDAFYKDFSNRRIKIIDALYVVKMQIEGENPELIDVQIRYLKMQPIVKSIIVKSLNKWHDYIKKNNRFPTYKEIKKGDYSLEDLLKIGRFVDSSDELHFLFCYGEYE